MCFSLVPRLHCPAFFVLWKNPARVFPKCKKRWAVGPGDEATLGSGARERGYAGQWGPGTRLCWAVEPGNEATCALGVVCFGSGGIIGVSLRDLDNLMEQALF